MTEQNNDGVFLVYNIKTGQITAYNDAVAGQSALADALEEAYKLKNSSLGDWKLMALSYGTTNNFIGPEEGTAVEPFKDGV